MLLIGLDYTPEIRVSSSSLYSLRIRNRFDASVWEQAILRQVLNAAFDLGELYPLFSAWQAYLPLQRQLLHGVP